MLVAIGSARALVLGAIAVVSAGRAFAAATSESLGVVAVAPPPGPGAALLEMTDDLRRHIAERQPGTLDVEELRVRSAPARADSLPELERAFARARAAYLEGDVEGSMRTLRQVADALEKLPGGDEVQALWTRTMMRLARTELDLGRRDAARATVERLLRGDPELAVDPALVPGRLVEEIESERARLRALPPGTIVVTSSTPGAQVYVNGRRVGTAPSRVVLPQGRCRVAATTATGQVGPVEVDLGDGEKQIALDFTISEALRRSSGQGLAARTEERARALVAAGEQLRLDRVVGVATVEDGGARYVLASLHDVRRGHLEREGRLRLADGAMPAGGDVALAEFMLTGRTDSPLVLVPGREVRAPTAPAPVQVNAPPPASPVLRWTPVVTAVAAFGFTAAAVKQHETAQDAYNRAAKFREQNALTTFRNVATYNGMVAEGDAAKQRMTIYWTGAALCAAATAIVWYWGYRRTGEAGPVRF